MTALQSVYIVSTYEQVPCSETKHHNGHQSSLWRFGVNELSSSERGHKTPPPFRSEPNPAYGQSIVQEQEVDDHELRDITSSQPQEPAYEDLYEN